MSAIQPNFNHTNPNDSSSSEIENSPLPFYLNNRVTRFVFGSEAAIAASIPKKIMACVMIPIALIVELFARFGSCFISADSRVSSVDNSYSTSTTAHPFSRVASPDPDRRY